MSKPHVDEISHLQTQVANLAAADVFDDAELLGTMMLSKSSKNSSRLPQVGMGSHLESLLIFADLLKRQREFKRAIDFYKQAATVHYNLNVKVIDVNTPLLAETSRQSVVSASCGSKENERRNSQTIDLEVLSAQIRFAIARCMWELKHKQGALKMLESISSKHRSAPILLWMGKIYEACGMDRPTVGALRDALRSQPYALSAIITLLRLGVNSNDVWQLCQTNTLHTDQGWLHRFIEAHGLKSLNQHRPALQNFQKLGQELPNNRHILANMADLNMQTNDPNAALALFRIARHADPTSLDQMDVYATIIHELGDAALLNRLTRELMDIDEAQPEPWLAVAMFCDLKGDAMSALKFVGKALELNPQHVCSYHFKGALQLRMNQPELSVSAYYKAYSIRRDFAAYRGLVNAYLAIPRVSDALRTAKEALQLMPKDPRAVLLVGRVLAQTPGDGRKKASKAYLKALKLDPHCHEAATALADLYIDEHHMTDNADLTPAIEVLKEALQHCPRDSLHVKLGDVYVVHGNLSSAWTEYNAALSMNSENVLAREGIDRLERLMPSQDGEEGEFELENESSEPDL
mmetsp:Transcript_16300/g.31623  ORF Transcript_16300/g.31623 Transcript_16300/m.31623 type:complete len:578 (+) Transcript_16300:558-2291(+)|eukprot:CAMPEP_0171520098 /NCGR_PEP_ID=MMETSP0959-20130129/6301_1 /TAXON_ID=87120 /ORGANISM="Aurantiochytrium limacinum, Strain ATCCMYA-1381" /LENGTH=577 /DNA_ID=CAMNT_0012059677 /DNA_START=647 /DNA_END=2380 /DNA_ORIENTATION=-